MLLAVVLTTAAQLSVDNFLGWGVGDGTWRQGSGSIAVAVGEEGGVIRFSAHSGDDVMDRWFVVERGHSYRVKPSACAGVTIEDLAKPKRRAFLQIDAHELANEGFPLRVMGIDGKTELDSIDFPDIGGAVDAPVDPKCPDLGARAFVQDTSGKVLINEWIVVPNERVTRVTLKKGGGFSATAFDAHWIYFREDARRVDAVELAGLRIEGKPYQVRHMHGGEAARVSMAIFEVKNASKKPKTLSAKSAVMLRDYGDQKLKLRGLSLGKTESHYGEGGEPAQSVVIPAGATVFVRAHVEPYDAYLTSIGSFFRWSIVFECDGKTVTATVPQHVMRMEPLRRDD